LLQWSKRVCEPNPSKKARRNYHVDQRPGQCNPQFLQRFLRQTFQPSYAPDRQQSDISRFDTITGRRQRMSELVQHHTREESENESHPFQRFCQALARRPMTQHDEADQNQKRSMHVDADAAKLAQLPGPFHD